MDKIALTIPEAVQASGIGRSKLYELFRRGDLKPRKAGKRTLIIRTELEAYISSLPVSA
jgi:excisionase family DNA binding protein